MSNYSISVYKTGKDTIFFETSCRQVFNLVMKEELNKTQKMLELKADKVKVCWDKDLNGIISDIQKLTAKKNQLLDFNSKVMTNTLPRLNSDVTLQGNYYEVYVSFGR